MIFARHLPTLLINVTKYSVFFKSSLCKEYRHRYNPKAVISLIKCQRGLVIIIELQVKSTISQYLIFLQIVIMPPKNFERDATRCQVQLISSLLRMAKMNMPVAAVWLHEDKPQVYGTRHLKRLLCDIEQVDVDNAIKLDVLNLSSPDPDEPLLKDQNDAPDHNVAQFRNSSESTSSPDLLPFPLSCMNRKEKFIWMTKEILRDQRRQSEEVTTRVKYGDPNLVPSFWPNEEWDWGQLTRNFSNISSNSYTGPGNLQDFVTRLISRCLNKFDKDPETYVKSNIDKTKLEKRKKSHKVHEGSHILEDVDEPSEREEVSVNTHDEEEVRAQTSQYRSPFDQPQPESSSFIPRRNLPDSAPYRCTEGLSANTASTDPGCGPPPPCAAPGCGPPSPCAAPVYDDQTQPPQEQSYTYIESGENVIFSEIGEPTLAETDFDAHYTGRWIEDPPGFLSHIPQPLHKGWKMVRNSGGGSCLFRAAADHIALKDFRHLRRYAHSHIEDQWHFFKAYFRFPLDVQIGTGNNSHYRNFPDEHHYIAFLRSEDSMNAWNTSEVEIIALGHVLNIDVLVLTYNMRYRRGPNTARTEWRHFVLNPCYAAPSNVFSRRTSEQLRLLHEDETHFSCLVWMPDSQEFRTVQTEDPRTQNSDISRPPSCRNPSPITPQKAGSVTRKKSKDKKKTKMCVKIVNTPISEILDRISK